MRVLALLLLGLSLAAQAPPQAARIFRGCQSCHGVPNPGLPGDDLWLERIRETACVQPPAPRARHLREALIAYLRSPAAPHPRVVRAGEKPGPGEGRLQVDFGPGSVLLVPVHGEDPGYRLVVAAGRETLPVPVGRYRVRNYRLHRRDREGVPWQLWVSGAKGPTITVHAGRTTRLRLETRVHLRFTAAAQGRELKLGLALTGAPGMGATLIRDGRRVLAQVLLLAGLRTVGEATLRYG